MADEQTPAEPSPASERTVQELMDDYHKEHDGRREKEALRGFEPYDIQDLDKCFHEDLEAIKNLEKKETKINRLLYILKETHIRVSNFNLAFPTLMEYGYLDGDEDRDFYLKRADSFRNKVELEIGMLKNTVSEASDNTHEHTSEETQPVVKTSICNQDDIKIEGEVSSKPDNSLLKTKEIWNINDLSKYLGEHLGRGWSARKINEGKYKEIPIDCWVTPPCNGKRRSFYFHSKKIITWANDYKPPPTNVPSEAPDTSSSNNKPEDNIRYLFKKHIEAFAKAFVEEGFLDDAKPMIERFSKGGESKCKIEWMGTIDNLLTFLFISYRLKYLVCPNLKTKNRSNIELLQGEEDNDDGKDDFPFIIVKDNFIEIEGGTQPTVSRRIKKYTLTLRKLRDHIKDKHSKDVDTINKAIEYYFEKEVSGFKFYEKTIEKGKEKKGIDVAMIEIIKKVYLEVNKNSTK
jgi:hypothetical protein